MLSTAYNFIVSVIRASLLAILVAALASPFADRYDAPNEPSTRYDAPLCQVPADDETGGSLGCGIEL